MGLQKMSFQLIPRKTGNAIRFVKNAFTENIVLVKKSINQVRRVFCLDSKHLILHITRDLLPHCPLTRLPNSAAYESSIRLLLCFPSCFPRSTRSSARAFLVAFPSVQATPCTAAGERLRYSLRSCTNCPHRVASVLHDSAHSRR